MLLQPDFPENPFALITTKKNRQLAKHLQDHGADAAKVNEILQRFYSLNMIRQAMSKRAKNPEWQDVLDWYKTVDKQYGKAIASLDILLSDDSIPSSTRQTIIKRDIDKLQVFRDFLTHCFLPKPLMKPLPKSVNQMIVFQVYAVFRYLEQFKGELTDVVLFDLMAEMFRKLYVGTALERSAKSLTGDILRKNFRDNAFQHLSAKKYDELERAIKPFLSK